LRNGPTNIKGPLTVITQKGFHKELIAKEEKRKKIINKSFDYSRLVLYICIIVSLNKKKEKWVKDKLKEVTFVK
jgi:hypothetical protein